MCPSGEITRVSSPESLKTVVLLAREIWNEYYVGLIGQAQVDYMLAQFQSLESLKKQMAEGFQYYLACRAEVPAGYFAVVPDADQRAMFISKFYVKKAHRGTGLGRKMIQFIETLCRQSGLRTLWLTVNKRNPSVAIYEQLGFRIADRIVQDIGQGFVMDDYRMEKHFFTKRQ